MAGAVRGFDLCVVAAGALRKKLSHCCFVLEEREKMNEEERTAPYISIFTLPSSYRTNTNGYCTGTTPFPNLQAEH